MMDCFISRDFCMYLQDNFYALRSTVYTIQDNSNAPRSTCGWTFWLQQDYGIDIKRFLVATNVETYEGSYTIM
jgi:uncharacterized protein (DUF1800 family)